MTTTPMTAPTTSRTHKAGGACELTGCFRPTSLVMSVVSPYYPDPEPVEVCSDAHAEAVAEFLARGGYVIL